MPWKQTSNRSWVGRDVPYAPDARKWRERSEVYRVMAEQARSEKGRAAFLSLAEDYDQLASTEEMQDGPPPERYYVLRAEECVRLAATARSNEARRLFTLLEQRWRTLAQQAGARSDAQCGHVIRDMQS
jgi:hypothetical protein